MLELERTGHIKREGVICSGFTVSFIFFSSRSLFFMQLYLKICHLLPIVLGMLPGMVVGLGICPNPVKSQSNVMTPLALNGDKLNSL